jgi:hypothetical protein
MKTRLTLILMFAIAALFIACPMTAYSKDSEQIQPFDPSTYFVNYAQPEKYDYTGNPLDYASARIGMDIRHFPLPRGWEGRYRFACRFPIIDYVSNDPLYMKQWTEDNAENISALHEKHGIASIIDILDILRGQSGYSYKAPEYGAELSAESIKVLRDQGFTDKYLIAISNLLKNYMYAREVHKQAFDNLTEEDLAFFRANPAYFIIPDGKSIPSITGNVETFFKFIEHARRVRYECIFNASEFMSVAIKVYTEATEGFTAQDYYKNPESANKVFRMKSAFGDIVISGFGDDTHDQDADFLIDLGGNDTYTNNAGGALETIAVCIDHSGNDIYNSIHRNYTQGFGFLGAGFLVDMQGSDTYIAKHFSQGAGIMGVGAIWDKNGDDVYEAHGFVQGAGIFGLGILLDSNGEDYYNCATLGQGAASTLGLGILSDLNGDDRYQLWIDTRKDNLGSAGYGQGGALSFRHYPWLGKLTSYGGVGMLVDKSGNDRYRTGGWCDQGGSYIMSLGALYDGGGNDHYTAGTGQGSGIHITNAILIDKDGNDVYDGGFRTGGSGSDRSPGFLIDYKGNDIYTASSSSYGTGCKPFSCSLMIDYEGDDKYIGPNPVDDITMNNWESFGGVWPESVSYLWPYAIFLDLGGDDDYQTRFHENNTERGSFGHGISIDCEYKGGDVIGKVECPYPPNELVTLPESVLKSKYSHDIFDLQQPDTFLRFQAIGRLTKSEPDVIEFLVDAIIGSEHRQFNRDALECIHYFLTDNKLTPKEIKHLEKLMNAKDPEVRIIAVDDFGIWNLASGEDALITALADENDQVRRFAINSLRTIKSIKGLSNARTLVASDPSEDVRRTCVSYLEKVRDSVNPYPYFADALQNDKTSSVKVAAASAIGSLQMFDGKDLVKTASQSDDIYLRRAGAQAMCDLYDVDGIKVLIDSLDFPSIDAFFNYNVNVPNSIATYSGHNFSEAERYDQSLWVKWFDENRDKIDIKANADAFIAYRLLAFDISTLNEEEKIAQYEKFLIQYPNHTQVKNELAAILNSLAWNMVTATEDSKIYNPKQGLEYAKRCVELDPQVNNVDTLIEAYIRNGMIEDAKRECEKWLVKFPGDGMLLGRLESLKKL